MTRDELENLIYERTRCFVDAPVADCIFDLIAAEREACLALVNQGTGEATSADALKILHKERDRISAAIRTRKN